MPWVQLTGNKERLTEAYLAWWFEGLAAKGNCPKLAAKAKRYAEILVEENDLMTGLSLLKCDDLFLENKAGMAKFHIQLMRENIMKRSPSPPPKGQGTMGNTNQEVLKHPDNRQEVLKPPDNPDRGGINLLFARISDAANSSRSS